MKFFNFFLIFCIFLCFFQFTLIVCENEWIPPLNTFKSVDDLSDWENAYHFENLEDDEYQCYYGFQDEGEVHYFTFDVEDPAQKVVLTLWKGIDGSENEYFPGMVLLGPNRLNFDKDQNSLPNDVFVPQGYDWWVKREGDGDTWDLQYHGYIPMAWYRTFQEDITVEEGGLSEGTYLVAIYAYGEAGHYAFAYGSEQPLHFSDYMLGPFHGMFTFNWMGYHPAVAILPYFFSVLGGVAIMSWQSCSRRNSPRTWFSWVSMIAGFLIMGQSALFASAIAYIGLQSGFPSGDDEDNGLITIVYTVIFILVNWVCAFMIVLLGLIPHPNYLIRVSIVFFGVASCLVWACFYVGPLIAVIGALLPATFIPFYKCWCCRNIAPFEDDIEHDIEIYDDMADKDDKSYGSDDRSDDDTEKDDKNQDDNDDNKDQDNNDNNNDGDDNDNDNGDGDDDNDNGDGDDDRKSMPPQPTATADAIQHLADDDDSTEDDMSMAENPNNILVPSNNPKPPSQSSSSSSSSSSDSDSSSEVADKDKFANAGGVLHRDEMDDY